MSTHTQSQPLKILQLVSAMETGGLERLLVWQVLDTPAEDVRFTVAVINDSYNLSYLEQLRSKGIAVALLKRTPRSRSVWGNLCPLLKLIKLVWCNHIQAIHVHDSAALFYAAMLKCFFPGLKTVYTVHDVYVHRQVRNKVLGFLHRHFVDCHVAISKAVEAECLAIGFQTRQIYNGIPLQEFQSAQMNGRMLDANALHVIQVSRLLIEKKGQDILLKAVARCKEKGIKVTCSIVGGVYDYAPQELETLEQLARSLNIQEEVRFLGDRKDVPALLSQADVYVQPSRYEGFGLTVVEAMAAGLPVIASRTGGPMEIIRHGETGLLFEVEDDAMLASYLQWIVENPESASKIAKAGAEASQKFSIRSMCAQLVTLYRDLVFGKRVCHVRN